jgi:hypothetical protein
VSFIPNVKVVDQYTGGLIQGADVYFEIHHQYCSGEENGYFNASGPTNFNGYFYPNMIYTYKYNSPEDEVKVYIKVKCTGYFDKEYNNTYFWHNIEGQSQINQTFIIKLLPSSK